MTSQFETTARLCPLIGVGSGILAGIAAATALISAISPAHAQSAPGISGQTIQISNEIRNSRAQAAGAAVQGEQIRLAREAEARQREALELARQRQAEAQALQFSSGANGEMALSLPSGGGLVPGLPGVPGQGFGAPGAGGLQIASPTTYSYTVNIQSGTGNVASNTRTETSLEVDETSVQASTVQSLNLSTSQQQDTAIQETATQDAPQPTPTPTPTPVQPTPGQESDG